MVNISQNGINPLFYRVNGRYFSDQPLHFINHASPKFLGEKRNLVGRVACSFWSDESFTDYQLPITDYRLPITDRVNGIDIGLRWQANSAILTLIYQSHYSNLPPKYSEVSAFLLTEHANH